jgi:hypothetical protein
MLSLRASGVIDDTNFFVNNDSKSEYISEEDMLTVAKVVFDKIKDADSVGILKLSDTCAKEYSRGIRLPMVTLLRFFLNTDAGTVGRTYVSLHRLEIAKVAMLPDNKIRVISVISHDEFEKALNQFKIVSNIDEYVFK